MSVQESLRRWTRPGARTIERFSDVMERRTIPVSAPRQTSDGEHGVQCSQYFCCCLVFPPSGSCGSNCKSPYRLRAWACCYGGRYYSCIECTQGSTCWSGTFKCSDIHQEPFSC